jgi:RimJ/RimL family protein N-acetyltransferase
MAYALSKAMEKVFLPSKIPLSQVLLKRRNMKDVYSAFDCVDSDRLRLREFLPWVDASNSVEDQVWYVGECLKDWDAGKFFDYGIFNSDEEFIGAIGVHNIHWDHNRCEIGYWIHQKYEGQGIISEALQTLEKVLFELGFHRIEVRCDPRNKKSAAVPLRNGYTFEGILREDVLSAGSYRDTAVYAKLKTDLKKL